MSSTSVGDLPLRTPTYRSLGEPLPHQQVIGRMPIFNHRNFLLFHGSESDRMGYYSEFLMTIPGKR